MDKQNPFSLYDFLGYFVPGSIAIFGSYLIANSESIKNFGDARNLLSNFGKTELLVPLTLFSYVLGHILSYLSSVIVERFSVSTVGYPSQFLINSRIKKERSRSDWIKFILASVILLPISISDWIIEKSLERKNTYAKPLSEVLITTVKCRLDSFAKEKAIPSANHQDDDIFRLVYHYAVENSSAHLTKMQNYVALYGFTRILTLVCVLFFWGFSILIIKNWQSSAIAEVPICIMLALFSVILYMDFMKFHRRCSQEVLMTLCVIYPPTDTPSKEKQQ